MFNLGMSLRHVTVEILIPWVQVSVRILTRVSDNVAWFMTSTISVPFVQPRREVRLIMVVINNFFQWICPRSIDKAQNGTLA
jgi:hypothetical protein